MKNKEIKQMSKEDAKDKIKELKMELIKTKTNPSKGGSSRIKEIKKMIAKILTINKQNGSMS